MSVACPRCHAPGIGPSEGAGAVTGHCPNCRAEIGGGLFVPAAVVAPGAGFPVGFGDEVSNCFFCPGQTATDVCASCGRFVCPRCGVDWGGQTTCLTCVHAYREERDDDRFRSRRILYDNLALSFLVWSLLVPFYGVFLLVVAAPVSLFLVIRYWKASRGLVPRGRARLWVAGGTALAVLVAALVGLGVLMRSGLW